MKRGIAIKILLAVLMLAFFAEHCWASSSLSIIIGDKEFHAVLDDNVTVQDIVKHLPLNLSLQRYAGHEYYAELSFRPEFAKERTSHILAGHLYYWDGWNSFVINYEDYDISPYKVVHLGAVDDEISELLRNSAEKINVTVKKAE